MKGSAGSGASGAGGTMRPAQGEIQSDGFRWSNPSYLHDDFVSALVSTRADSQSWERIENRAPENQFFLSQS